MRFILLYRYLQPVKKAATLRTTNEDSSATSSLENCLNHSQTEQIRTSEEFETMYESFDANFEGTFTKIRHHY
jgi:hypothetical protein